MVQQFAYGRGGAARAIPDRNKWLRLRAVSPDGGLGGRDRRERRRWSLAEILARLDGRDRRERRRWSLAEILARLDGRDRRERRRWSLAEILARLDGRDRRERRRWSLAEILARLSRPYGIGHILIVGCCAVRSSQLESPHHDKITLPLDYQTTRLPDYQTIRLSDYSTTRRSNARSLYF